MIPISGAMGTQCPAEGPREQNKRAGKALIALTDGPRERPEKARVREGQQTTSTEGSHLSQQGSPGGMEVFHLLARWATLERGSRWGPGVHLACQTRRWGPALLNQPPSLTS